MRTKITLVLLIAVCISLSYIIFFEKDYNTDPRISDARSLILSSEIAEIDYLKIEASRLPSNPILKKTIKGWELVSPVSWPANFFAVNRILAQLQFLEKENSFLVEQLNESGQTLADFGLDPADLTLTYGQKGEVNQIKIGHPTAMGNRLYILSPDKLRIHVVSLSLLESLSVRIEELRSNDIFETPVFEIHSWNLQLKEPGNLRVRLTQKNNNWLFETPISARANEAAVETLLNQIADLDNFVDGNFGHEANAPHVDSHYWYAVCGYDSNDAKDGAVTAGRYDYIRVREKVSHLIQIACSALPVVLWQVN